MRRWESGAASDMAGRIEGEAPILPPEREILRMTFGRRRRRNRLKIIQSNVQGQREATTMTKKIGRFDIVRELGRGAQSVVYLARDPHLEREVAIKTLHFTRPDPEQNRVLLAEARTVSQMRHPNIVPIFEAGEEGATSTSSSSSCPARTSANTCARAEPCHRYGPFR